MTGRIRELLVRSPGFSRRGPGLASQRAGRWRARPAKAGTPNEELANAPVVTGRTTDFFGVGGRLSLTPRFSEVGVAREPAPQPLQRFTVVGKPLKQFRPETTCY